MCISNKFLCAAAADLGAPLGEPLAPWKDDLPGSGSGVLTLTWLSDHMDSVQLFSFSFPSPFVQRPMNFACKRAMNFRNSLLPLKEAFSSYSLAPWRCGFRSLHGVKNIQPRKIRECSSVVAQGCPLPCRVLCVQVAWCIFRVSVCENLTVGNQDGIIFHSQKTSGISPACGPGCTGLLS